MLLPYESNRLGESPTPAGRAGAAQAVVELSLGLSHALDDYHVGVRRPFPDLLKVVVLG